jgi:hypothetical protein
MIQLDPFPERAPRAVDSSAMPKDQAVLELELSADELGGLSPPHPTKRPTDVVALPADRRVSVASSVSVSMRRPIAWMQWRPATRVGLLLTVVITAVGMTIALRPYSIQQPPASPALGPVAITATRVPLPTQLTGEGLPLRFRNPFDRKEVFTFPPGTSLADARAQVADMLMKRAQERLSHPQRLARPHRASHDPLMATRAPIPHSLPNP